jgi:hypothetical protein
MGALNYGQASGENGGSASNRRESLKLARCLFTASALPFRAESWLSAGLDQGHVNVGEAKMVTDLVDQHAASRRRCRPDPTI